MSNATPAMWVRSLSGSCGSSSAVSRLSVPLATLSKYMGLSNSVAETTTPGSLLASLQAESMARQDELAFTKDTAAEDRIASGSSASSDQSKSLTVLAMCCAPRPSSVTQWEPDQLNQFLCSRQYRSRPRLSNMSRRARPMSVIVEESLRQAGPVLGCPLVNVVSGLAGCLAGRPE